MSGGDWRNGPNLATRSRNLIGLRDRLTLAAAHIVLAVATPATRQRIRQAVLAESAAYADDLVAAAMPPAPRVRGPLVAIGYCCPECGGAVEVWEDGGDPDEYDGGGACLEPDPGPLELRKRCGWSGYSSEVPRGWVRADSQVRTDADGRKIPDAQFRS